jgi:FkbM family methyltransferase
MMELIEKLRPKSYAQFEQDLRVVEFYRGLRGGYFLDLGAYDGLDNSNTVMLEREMDWKGLCVEPWPWAFEKLVECRTAKCENMAAYRTSGQTVPFTEYEQLSGISSYIDAYPEAQEKGPSLEVETISVNDLLAKHDAPVFIHYASIDTEGSELEILKGVDFSKYVFGYINIEHNFIEPRRSQMQAFLAQQGYIFRGENDVDDDFIHRSLIEGVYCDPLSDARLDITIDAESRAVSAADAAGNILAGEFLPEPLMVRWASDASHCTFYAHCLEWSDGRLWNRL